MKLSQKDTTVQQILTAAFPEAKPGRPVDFESTEKIECGNTFWDEGSRYSYAGVNLENMQGMQLPHKNPPQFGGPSQVSVTMRANLAVVEKHSWRGGTYWRIYVHPSNATKLLPKEETISERDKEVLSVFTGLIAAARKQALFELNATTEELQSLRERGFIKTHKNKESLLARTGEKEVFVGYGKKGAGYNSPFAYPYELAGAKATLEGQNAVSD